MSHYPRLSCLLIAISLAVMIGGCTGKAAPTTSTNAPSQSEPVAAVPVGPVEIGEKGWEACPTGALYAVELRNTRSGAFIVRPELAITAKDSNGKVLFEGSDTIGYLRPGQTMVWASNSLVEGGEVASMDFAVKADSSMEVPAGSFPEGGIEDPRLTQSSLKTTAFDFTFEGSIDNPNPNPLNRATMFFVVRDSTGKLKWGTQGFLRLVAAGTSPVAPGSMYGVVAPGDTMEVSAVPW